MRSFPGVTTASLLALSMGGLPAAGSSAETTRIRSSPPAGGTWRVNGRIVDPNVAGPELMQRAAAHLRDLAIQWTQQSIARARDIKL